LDEATANLDKQTEIALVDTLAKLKSNMTIVAVTHREELLRIADKHLVMPFKE
jgi:ATP-binding cassette subfamily B protein